MAALYELSGTDPDAIAIDDGERHLSWADLEARSTAVGNGLEALGAGQGAHVAICVSNRAEFVEAVIGSWRAGNAYTPMKTGWTADEVGAILDDAATSVVITDRDGARTAAAARGIPVIDLDDGYDAWLGAQSAVPLPADRAGYKLPYTSGTTGRPKGVVMSGSGVTPFAAGWAGIARWAEIVHLPGDGTHLFLSRLFNGAPQTFGFGALARGATLRILKRWDPATALVELSRPDATSTIMVPTMFRQLLALPGVDRTRPPNPNLHRILHGGEPCPAPIKEAMADWFGEILVEYYGFTEGGMTVVGADEWRSRPGTVGRPFAGMEVRVLDSEGHDVAANVEGTVYFQQSSGQRRFHYQGEDGKTESAHAGAAFTVGDIGYLDDEGFLYLCGRSADVVLVAGVNVYPAEIEHALADVDGVADLCAVGVPDAERGEAIVLHIALLPDADRDAVLAAIDARTVERIAPYKRPRSITIVDEIPRDQTGKLLRRVLRDPLWASDDQHAARGPC